MCIIKRIALAAIMLSFTTLTHASSQAASDLKNLLAPINTIKAEFAQTVVGTKAKVLQQATGNLEFKRPNLFRWEVESPDNNLVVTDGTKLWNYDVELEQVTVQAFTASDEVSPVSFLFDDSEKLSKDFEIAKITDPHSACHKHASICFKLTPKKANPNFVNVELGFSGHKISSLQMLDNLGQTSVFEFKNVHQNLKIANTRFTFTPPDGVDVIGEQYTEQ